MRRRKLRESRGELWYGIPGVEFIWNGEWSDPDIEYKGKIFNSHDVEDAMWERFCEDYPEESESDDMYDYFADYMHDNRDDVYDLLEDLISFGYGEDSDY